MKKETLFILSCLISNSYTAQLNVELKNQLDSIQQLDQLYRTEVHKVLSDQPYIDSLSQSKGFDLANYVKEIMLKQEEIDQSNVQFIDRIITEYGYPGKKLVGEGTNLTAWFIMQHSEKLDSYFHLIQKAAKKGDIPDSLFAKTKDRHLIQHGKKQWYGTQAACSPTSSGNFECTISPIRKPRAVNQRRKKVGFTLTIEQYAKLNGYKLPWKLND